jgi:LysM repeat protein
VEIDLKEADMNRHHLLLLLIALLIGLIIALLTHSVVVSAPLAITATPSPSATPTPTPAFAPVTYVVQRGDTLAAIGRRFGVNYLDIARANNIINPSLIRVGQVLIIPTGGSAPPTVTPTATPSPGGTLRYTVQRGDTLYRIALRFGTTIAAIRAANNLANVNLIHVGQVLVIPTGSTAPTPIPTPTPTFPPAPTPTVLDIPAAFQPFEKGFMIWLGDRKRIWIAACCTSTIPRGGSWLAYDDTFVDGMPETDPSIVPPPGLYQPRRGFGLVWRTLNDTSHGGTLRDLLGWATALEQGYTAHVEYHPGGFYDPMGHWNGRPGTWTINTPDGKRYYFHEAGPAWSQIEP